MLLEITESRMEPEITVLHLAGRLALGRESQRIEGMIAGFLADGRVRIILDLTRVEYMDSAGIGLLALAAGQLKEAGGQLVLLAGAGRVRSLLQLTRLDDLMPLRESLEQGAVRLGSGPPPACA